MDKKEALREITEIIAMQETAIQNHDNKLVSAYENTREVVKNGQHTSWDAENGELLPLSDNEIAQINKFITSSSFISAWYHLAGEKKNRDKAAHTCATLISVLGPHPEEVMRKYIETEQLWRRVIKKSGASPKKIGLVAIIFIVLIIGTILMVVFAYNLMQIHTSTINFTLLAAFAWTILSYDVYAARSGWPVGEMFAADASMIKIASFIGLPGSAISAGYLAAWWSSIVVIVVGFFVALVLTQTLRSYAQPISIVGLAMCWVVGILMLSQA